MDINIETKLRFRPCSPFSPQISVENEHLMLFNIDLGGKGGGVVSLIYVHACSLFDLLSNFTVLFLKVEMGKNIYSKKSIVLVLTSSPALHLQELRTTRANGTVTGETTRSERNFSNLMPTLIGLTRESHQSIYY